MTSKRDKIAFALIGLMVLLVFVFGKDNNALQAIKTESEKVKEDKEKKSNIKGNEGNGAGSLSEVVILQKWELPYDLREVSGIAYIDDQRFACIQDEAGKIFIFNRTSKKIEKEIPFAALGDYEGLAVKGNTAYVVRADGRIYELDMNVGKSSVKEYKTPLTIKHNVEGLCYDKKNDRLLLAIKDNELGNPGYKGIYAFDLAKKALVKEPVFKIDLGHKVFNLSKNKKRAMMPSSIGIHSTTGEIFITDGHNARLLIMDNSGNIKKLYQLGKGFAQPEGISFSPGGEIFISNEGTKQPGNIVKVEIQ